MIAKTVFGNEKRMDVLMEANRDLLDYLIFPAGVMIRIPNQLPEDIEDLPVWRR